MFDPEKWLNVADVCCGTIPGVDREALFRTALNRAYYAVLMLLKLRIDTVQGPGAVPAWGTHEALRQAVRTGGPTFREISEALDKLRAARERADYDLTGGPITFDNVRRAITIARWLIHNRLKPMPDSDVRRLRVPRG